MYSGSLILIIHLFEHIWYTYSCLQPVYKDMIDIKAVFFY